MRSRRIVPAVLFILLAANIAAAEVPAWLRQAATAGVGTYGKDVPVVILLNQRADSIDNNGRVTNRMRYALKILTAPGKEMAIARALYSTDTAEVKQLHAWLIHSSGSPKEFDKKETLDLALLDNDVYNEVRVRSIVASSDAQVGDVFGYEVEIEDRSVFTQIEWPFQNRLPVLTSRYSISLPSGWRATSMTFNGPAVEPVVAENTFAWELQNLPFIPDEEAQPSLSQLTRRLAVNILPAARTGSAMNRTFPTWGDVSQWLSELADPSAVPDDAISRKSMELTSRVSDTIDKVRAIGEYVQKIQYISIQTGLGRGGGYRPHTAADVFKKSYGDCKDKANLMRTMLKTVGITSYPVSIYSGDPLYVHPEWPSPQQFNHAVIAIKIGENADIRSTIVDPKLGKLLIFDPTDPETPVGSLPESLHGSYALIDAGADGDLRRMPPADSHLNRVSREITASLAGDGSLTANVTEGSTGHRAVDERRSYRGMPRPDWNSMIAGWILRGAPGAAIRKIDASDDKDQEFTIRADFAAPRYGQIMNNRLLVFRATVISRSDFVFSAPGRESPIWLESASVEEKTHFTLPAGFDVDELPEPTHLETPFGSYDSSCKVADQQLTCVRNRSLTAGLLPAKDYSSVQKFFKAIADAEQAPVVLIRKQ